MTNCMHITIGLIVLYLSPAWANDHVPQRNKAEQATRSVVGPSMTTTRRDNGVGPTSKAHGDGRAFDYVSRARTWAERDVEARSVSRATGPGVTVIVETPLGARSGGYRVPGLKGPGPKLDRHDSYKAGQKGRTTYQPPRATGNHTHVQVDAPNRHHR